MQAAAETGSRVGLKISKIFGLQRELPTSFWMSSSSFITSRPKAANNDQCSLNNDIFIVGEASPPIVLDLAHSETQMESQSGADTTENPARCRGRNQDGSQCVRLNVTTTKQWQKNPSKHDKTEGERYLEASCTWCSNKIRKESIENGESTDQSVQVRYGASTSQYPLTFLLGQGSS